MTAARGPELLSVRDLLARRWAEEGSPPPAVPAGVVLCHQAGVLRAELSRWHAKPARGFRADFRVLRRMRGRVAVATRFGTGAPAAVALLEELIEYGVRRFISIGLAGALGELKPGDVVIAERAIGEDGTSPKYAQNGGPLTPSESLTTALRRAMTDRGLAYTMGIACSTDAPYRTMWSDVERWQGAGGTVVDMETAGLVAAADLRGAQLTAAYCVADGPAHDGWRVTYDRQVVMGAMRGLYAAAVSVLS